MESNAYCRTPTEPQIPNGEYMYGSNLGYHRTIAVLSAIESFNLRNQSLKESSILMEFKSPKDSIFAFLFGWGNVIGGEIAKRLKIL